MGLWEATGGGRAFLTGQGKKVVHNWTASYGDR